MRARILGAVAAGIFSFAAAGKAAGEPPLLPLNLPEAEARALDYSPRLKAADHQSAAARERAAGRKSLLIPRLTLDGSYRYVTEVPSLQIGPVRQTFGDHRATSIGPTLTWTLWDQGALRQEWQSQLARARSLEDSEELTRRQVLLGARLAYFQLQLALENVRLLADFMNLADSQYQDIQKRLKAGSASRADILSAHQEVLNRRKDFRQARADLAASLREFFGLTGSTAAYDLSFPMDSRAAADLPQGMDSPTLLVSLQAPAALTEAAQRDFDPGHPQVRMYADQAESSRSSARSAKAGAWPKVQFSGRSSYDYPNGPVLENIQQNAVALTASVPVFDDAKTSRDAGEQEMLAAQSEENRRQAADDLRRDWLKARDQWAALRDQEVLDRESVSETEELAKLKYISYKQGGSTFLEVQSANLYALQAKVSAARTRSQILIQLATLDNLSLH